MCLLCNARDFYLSASDSDEAGNIKILAKCCIPSLLKGEQVFLLTFTAELQVERGQDELEGVEISYNGVSPM